MTQKKDASIARLQRENRALKARLDQNENGVTIASLEEGTPFTRIGTHPGKYTNHTTSVNSFMDSGLVASSIESLLKSSGHVIAVDKGGNIIVLPDALLVTTEKRKKNDAAIPIHGGPEGL